MTQEHPITPPPELIEKWRQDTLPGYRIGGVNDIATQAARWGADQELEACCEWLETYVQRWAEWSAEFRADRRPKPPSLKEQALQALYRFDDTEGHDGLTQEQIAEDFVLIRRALESLPD